MQKAHYSFLFTCFINLTSFAQADKCDTINWTKKTKLNWSNFKAKPDTASSFKAVSVAGIGYNAQNIGDTLMIGIHCSFYTCESWTKSGSGNLLKHEQTHFDIAEYFKRLFIKKLTASQLKRQSAFAQIQSIYEEIERLRDDFDNKYDSETNFSRNKAKQDKWMINIRMRIDKLNLIDKEQVTIYLKD